MWCEKVKVFHGVPCAKREVIGPQCGTWDEIWSLTMQKLWTIILLPRMGPLRLMCRLPRPKPRYLLSFSFELSRFLSKSINIVIQIRHYWRPFMRMKSGNDPSRTRWSIFRLPSAIAVGYHTRYRISERNEGLRCNAKQLWRIRCAFHQLKVQRSTVLLRCNSRSCPSHAIHVPP